MPLRLFSEIDLAKILANARFNDFNHEQLSFQLDEAGVEERLRPFLQPPHKQSYNGVSRKMWLPYGIT